MQGDYERLRRSSQGSDPMILQLETLQKTLRVVERLKEKKRQAQDHKDRVKWLVSYDAWRNSHAQRWDVAANMAHIKRLNALVDDAHAFMQQQVNAAVRSMHGNRAIIVHDRGTRLDWATISKQLSQYGT